MYKIDEILKENYEKYNHNYIYERTENEFVPKTYKKFVDDVHGFAAYLQGQNLSHKKIGIYGRNSYPYMVADMAIMGFVGVSVGISKDWLFGDLEKAVEFLALDALIYSKENEEIILKLKPQFPSIVFISMDKVSGQKKIDLKQNTIDPSKCSKIVFSSGTTGTPKAVMLSQNNMFACWDNLQKRAPMNKGDKCYLFLPLHHTYAGICNFLYSTMTGMSIYLCSDTKNIVEELKMVKPTVFCSVPLIYEKLYDLSVNQDVELDDIFGTEIKYLFSGGARLEPKIRQYMKENKLNLLEAYGLSETSSLLSVEYSNEDDFESVGTVFENVDLKITNPNKEGVGDIVAKGDNIFLGYYNNEKKTKEAFNEEGYFCTGDLGYIKNEKLYIVGRKQKKIVLSSGENVYTDELEEMFKKYREIIKSEIFEKEGYLFAKLYTHEQMDCTEIIEDINSELPSYSKIQGYVGIIMDESNQ